MYLRYTHVFVSKKLITLLSSSLFTVIVEVESALSSFVFPILIFLVITCTFAGTHRHTLQQVQHEKPLESKLDNIPKGNITSMLRANSQ
jgi:hypothetical protein